MDSSRTPSIRHLLIESLQLAGAISVPELNRLARIAANATLAPIALVTFVDDNRQWTPARVGWDGTFMSLADAFCTHAIEGTSLLEVRQAHRDERFKGSRLVTGPTAVRSYAGHPIIFSGVAIGTVCILDQKSRALTHAEREVLGDLAEVAADVLLARQYSIAARNQPH